MDLAEHVSAVDSQGLAAFKFFGNSTFLFFADIL
jgi:hypothetical protein